MQIDLYADVVCPWCYLGTAYLREALAGPVGADVAVRVRSFQLDPAAPSAPRPLVDVLGARYGPERVGQMVQTVAARGREAGIAIALDPSSSLSGNTALAHQVLQAAWEAGSQHEVVSALYRAHFAEGRSVFEEASLRAIAAGAGMSAAAIDAAFADPQYVDRVAEDQQQASALGITAVPFFVIDGRFGVAGAQPAPALRQVLQQVREAA